MRRKRKPSERIAAQIARGVEHQTAASDWDDPLVTDFRTELEAAWRRAKGLCRLCGESVSLTMPHRHPLEATIDHIIPVSKGGGDDRANLQLAHRGCNSRKGAR